MDTILGEEARVLRTVLRSEVLRIVLGGPLDVLITASDASFLGSAEFLAAFARRAQPVSLLMLTRTLDDVTRDRLRSADVEVEYIPPPVDLAGLRERVHHALQRRAATLAARRARPRPTASEEILPPPHLSHPVLRPSRPETPSIQPVSEQQED